MDNLNLATVYVVLYGCSNFIFIRTSDRAELVLFVSQSASWLLDCVHTQDWQTPHLFKRV